MIEELYEEYIDKVYGFFYYKTFNKSIAEDLTSETFIIFVQKINDEVKIEDNKKFLYGIMRNVWLRYLQKKYKEAALDIENIEDFADYVESNLEIESLKDEKDRLVELIAKLPEKQQRVIRMRFIDELTLKQICESLDKNMNYVKTTQRRGLRTMTRLIEELALIGGATS